MGGDLNAAFRSSVGQASEGAFPCHPRSQRLHVGVAAVVVGGGVGGIGVGVDVDLVAGEPAHEDARHAGAGALQVDAGLLGNDNSPFYNSHMYQGYGIGLLVKNELLVISTFQFSFGFYPNVPGRSSQTIFNR